MRESPLPLDRRVSDPAEADEAVERSTGATQSVLSSASSAWLSRAEFVGQSRPRVRRIGPSAVPERAAVARSP